MSDVERDGHLATVYRRLAEVEERILMALARRFGAGFDLRD
jgi:hypothetical protein